MEKSIVVTRSGQPDLARKSGWSDNAPGCRLAICAARPRARPARCRLRRAQARSSPNFAAPAESHRTWFRHATRGGAPRRSRANAIAARDRRDRRDRFAHSGMKDRVAIRCDAIRCNTRRTRRAARRRFMIAARRTKRATRRAALRLRSMQPRRQIGVLPCAGPFMRSRAAAMRADAHARRRTARRRAQRAPSMPPCRPLADAAPVGRSHARVPPRQRSANCP